MLKVCRLTLHKIVRVIFEESAPGLPALRYNWELISLQRIYLEYIRY